ncbi:MAG: T9SS type A sorting domain-containing protein [Bacteroidota bacterium]
MKRFIFKYLLLVYLIGINSINAFSQNSLLVNVGSIGCASPEAPILSIIKQPLTDSATALVTCDMAVQLPSYYFTFVAYNPLDNKIYVNDTRNFFYSKVWKMDMGLPNDITCPSLTDTPTYILNYTINNFEFDNSGNLWAISNYDYENGRCTIQQFEINTGNVLATKTLQFQEGFFPSDISSGDLSILPNGRLFATLGQYPSKLYEITNYNGGNGDAIGTYLQTMPSNTYGVAYLNGQLEITGTNSIDSCYYFDYNISLNTLGEKKNFQAGQAPIDNTSISPAIGITKQLMSVTKVNGNSADVTYEIYVQNMGNTILQNINVTDDLVATFEDADISDITTNFVAGFNQPGLILNTGYNGATDKNLLVPGQSLANQTSSDKNYLFKITVSLRVRHLKNNTVYFNSAIASGTIGAGFSLINLEDTSNNGPSSAIDPNNNGNANEAGENEPTPLEWRIILPSLPVNFVSINAKLQNSSTALIQWQVATPTINADKFEIEYSNDGINWKTLSLIPITNTEQYAYQTEHNNIPVGNLYYRIKQVDRNGQYIFSKIVMVKSNATNNFTVYPNPATDHIYIDKNYGVGANSLAELYNAVGQLLMTKKIINDREVLKTAQLADGTYLLKILNSEEVKTYKILIRH